MALRDASAMFSALSSRLCVQCLDIINWFTPKKGKLGSINQPYTQTHTSRPMNSFDRPICAPSDTTTTTTTTTTIAIAYLSCLLSLPIAIAYCYCLRIAYCLLPNLDPWIKVA